MPVGTDTQLHRLVERARSGDDGANALLIEHACDRLLRLTRAMFRGYPGLHRWEQTDDVFQNALLRLHRALSSVRVESVRHFFNLAAEMVRRELLDLKKHHYGAHGTARNHHTDRQPADEAGGTIARGTTSPEDLDDWSEFHAGVESLPVEVREVVNLLYYEGLSQAEAAELLEVAPRTVKRRWQRAKLLLHEALCDGSG